MIDLFSSEFLTNLKQQLKLKTKPSKALLDAMKDLTSKNAINKKRISELQSQILNLKNQNSMLMEIIQSNKLDYQTRIQLKQKKLQNAIQVEAKLYSENQAYKRQIQRLKQQILIIKNSSTISKQISQQYQAQYQATSQKQLMLVKKGSSQADLNAYLFSPKGKQKSQQQSQGYTQNNSQFSPFPNIKITQQDDQFTKSGIKKIPQNTISQSNIIQYKFELGLQSQD